MSQKVIPAIIPESLDHLEESLTLLHPFAKEVQIDIVDGVFVPFISWPYVGRGSVGVLARYSTQYDIEVDLMIMHPENVIDRYAEMGIGRIVVHLESVNDIERIFSSHKSHTYQLGFSILNDTPLEMLTPYIDRIDYVQLMGIAQIGSQGQPFDLSVLDRVRTLQALYPTLPISIDGSMNRETLPRLKEAGAVRFVAGSSILGADDPERAFYELEALAE